MAHGSYLTYKYTVQFGNVSATAYCVEPSKSSPGSGTYDITKLSDGKKLAKVCYYGTKASGDEGFFTEENGYGNLSAGCKIYSCSSGGFLCKWRGVRIFRGQAVKQKHLP